MRNPRQHARREAVGTLAALGAVWLLILADLAPLLGGAIPWDPDVATTFLPFKAVGAAMLQQGRLPLWTPLVGLGFPLVAEGQAALLYPPDVALLVSRGPVGAIAASVVVHGLLGSALMFAFLRRGGLSRPAGTVGAFVWSFTGPLLPLAGTPKLAVGTWWPALLLATDGIAGASWWGARGGWAALGALGAALMLLAGHPQTALQGLLLAGAYAVYRAWGRRSVGVLVWGAVMVALGAGLAAPQLLATAELAGQSARAQGAGALAGQGSLFPLGLVQLAAPNWNFAATLGGMSPNLYVGIVPLALGVLAIVRRRPGWACWLAVAAVATLLAFGRFSPLFPVVRTIPVLSLFRNPATYLYVATFALAVLAGTGLDALRAAPPAPAHHALTRPLARAALVLGVVAVVADVSGLLLFRGLGAPLIGAVAGLTGVSLEGREERMRAFIAQADAATGEGGARLLAPFVGLAGLAALVVLLRSGRPAGTTAVAILATVLDLTLGAPRANLARPPWPEELVALVGRLGGGRLYSFGDPFLLADGGRYDLLPASLHAFYGLPGIGLYNPLGDPTYRDLLRPLGAVNLAFDAVTPAPESVVTHRRLLDLLGVTVVLSPQPLEGLTPAGRLASGGAPGTPREVYVYRNPAAFPRAWVARETRVSPPDARAALLDPDLDLRRVVLVPEGVPDVPPAGEGPPGAAQVVRDDGASVEIAASGPGVLVLADRWAPGWEAVVDGEWAPLWRVDGALRGVPLPAGEHRVRLSYRPAAFGAGVSLAGAAGAGCLMLAAGGPLVAALRASRASRAGRASPARNQALRRTVRTRNVSSIASPGGAVPLRNRSRSGRGSRTTRAWSKRMPIWRSSSS